MAWNQTSQNGYLVATETIRESVGAGNHFSSVIDFLPAGKDFTIIANAGGTDLSTSTNLEMWACDTSGGTFVRVQSRLTDASTTAKKNIDTTPHAYQWDGSIDGWYPYYKLNVYAAGACDVGDTIKLVIMCKAGKVD